MSQAGIVNLDDVPLPPDVPITFKEDFGSATAINNILNVNGGPGISTEGLTNNITISVEQGGFQWSYAVADADIFQQEAFVCLASLTVSLPPTTGGMSGDLALGDMVYIYVDTDLDVTVLANSGQQIQLGDQTSVSDGTIISSAKGSMVQLFFSTNDSIWHAMSPQGSWTVQTS